MAITVEVFDSVLIREITGQKTPILAYFRHSVFTDSFNHSYGYYRWNYTNRKVIWSQFLATSTTIKV